MMDPTWPARIDLRPGWSSALKCPETGLPKRQNPDTFLARPNVNDSEAADAIHGSGSIPLITGPLASILGRFHGTRWPFCPYRLCLGLFSSHSMPSISKSFTEDCRPANCSFLISLRTAATATFSDFQNLRPSTGIPSHVTFRLRSCRTICNRNCIGSGHSRTMHRFGRLAEDAENDATASSTVVHFADRRSRSRSFGFKYAIWNIIPACLCVSR
jgi:hypothetical protein